MLVGLLKQLQAYQCFSSLIYVSVIGRLEEAMVNMFVQGMIH